MKVVRFSCLRGICQTPAYVAHGKGFLADEGIDARLSLVPTAWMVPDQLQSGECDFAVIPWTRVAAREPNEGPLRLLCGSGHEEAVIVIRKGMKPEDVRIVAIPREGGIKDLTAMGLVESLGWSDCELRRFPSGDGAILAFVGGGADAASMVEPYGAMIEQLGLGVALRRTGDIWPGAPGCSLSASAGLVEREPALVQRVVNAYVRAAAFVAANPDEAAQIAAPYIGIDANVIRRALAVNLPNVNAIRNADVMRRVLQFMDKLGYVNGIPDGYMDLRFLDQAQQQVVMDAANV